MSRKHQELLLARGFAVLSVLISFACVYYSVGVLNSPDATRWLRIFAYLAGGYGLANIYLLSLAWRLRAPWTAWASKLFAFCFVGAVAADALRDGFGGVHEAALLLVVAAVAWVNWFTVTRAIGRPAA